MKQDGCLFRAWSFDRLNLMLSIFRVKTTNLPLKHTHTHTHSHLTCLSSFQRVTLDLVFMYPMWNERHLVRVGLAVWLHALF